MEQKFSNNSLDLETLREFCKQEGEAVTYRKGDQLEREGDPARWFAFVTEGCFKYVKYGVSERLRVLEGSSVAERRAGGRSMGFDKAHITWFSFEGEFVVDYPTFLYGRPSQTTIEAMMPSRVLRVTGQQLEQFFDQSKETMKLRAAIAEHILSQFRSRYLDLHCTTARERYDLLMQRCPGIVELLDLQDIASFLNVHPNTISKIRRNITFDGK